MHATITLLLAAEQEVPLIDIDHTLWIQLGLFLLLLLFLSRVVFRPYLRLRDARGAAMEGARVKAREMQEQAARELADFEVRLNQARHRGAEERMRIQSEGAAREGAVLTAAREEAARVLDTSRAALEAQARTLRAHVRPHVIELATAVAAKLLGRQV
jgi:F-type H+-transporting ATPase subunit b